MLDIYKDVFGVLSQVFSLLEVIKILGHSNVAMTMRYAHLESQETAKKARDILKRVSKTVKPDLHVVR